MPDVNRNLLQRGWAVWCAGAAALGASSTAALAQTNGAIYELEPAHAAGMRLDVAGVSTADGAQVQIWSDADGNNQRWKLEDQGNGYWEIIPQHATSMRLDVSGSGTSNGTNVQIWGDNNSNAQRWKLITP